MRVVRVPAPMRWYLAQVPLLGGALLIGAGATSVGVVLVAAGAVAFVGFGAWWGHRVAEVRREEGLTTRDMIEIEYPPWARRLATGYVAVLAGSVGLLIVLAVVFVIVAVATR